MTADPPRSHPVPVYWWSPPDSNEVAWSSRTVNPSVWISRRGGEAWLGHVVGVRITPEQALRILGRRAEHLYPMRVDVTNRGELRLRASVQQVIGRTAAAVAREFEADYGIVIEFSRTHKFTAEVGGPRRFVAVRLLADVVGEEGIPDPEAP